MNLLKFEKKTFPDYCKGGIVHSSLINIDHKGLNHKCKAKDKDFIITIDGEWTNFIRFDEKHVYWSKDEYQIPVYNKPKFTLPSDSSLRNDIIAFKGKNKEEA